MRPKGPSTIAQGEPFRAMATITNNASTARTINVTFSLLRLGSSAPAVDFDRFAGSVPAGGDITVETRVTTGQYFANRGDFKILSKVDGATIGRGVKFEVTKPTVRAAKFSDVTSSSGIAAQRGDYVCGQWALGSAWGDIDGDGDLDLWAANQDGPAQMFVNDGAGHFTDEASARGVDNGGLKSTGGVFADYDNDGDQDLYVVNNGKNRLYQNNGSGTFTDVATAAGVDDAQVGSSAAWGDYDNDGLLDLYVTNYAICANTATFTYQRDKLYHNEGNGTFTDQTALIEGDPTTTADGATIGAGFLASWFDYDRDGDQDLFLANDFLGPGPDSNRFFRNDGPTANGGWDFTDVSVASGLLSRMNTMGVAVGDYDRDRDLDFALSNISSQKLMRNNGDGTFTDVGPEARIDRPNQVLTNKSITWGLVFYDLNLDGWEDLYVAAGPLKTSPDPQANEVLLNDKGKFDDLSAASRADSIAASRGIAAADYNNDGLIDIYVMNHMGSSILYKNTTSKTDRHWLRVDTVGTSSNRDGCGAFITLRAASGTQVRQVLCGSTSLASGSDSRVHFGLKDATKVDKLTIEWPSGVTQTLTNLKADRTIAVAEPSGK